MATVGSIPSNFPTAPQKSYNYASFPNDLVASGRNFKTDIQFVEYNGAFMVQSLFGSGPTYTPAGGISLPIPRKINDTTSTEWARASLLEMGLSLAPAVVGNLGGTLGGAIGAFTGQTLNPFQFMMFKHPNFKEHILQWQLAPSTPDESNTLAYIIEQFKYHMLPSLKGGGMLYDYPSIALVKLYPNDDLTYRFRPAAIIGVQVDFSGGGGPSFFKNGAPTVVNLSVQLREITLWDKTNFNF